MALVVRTEGDPLASSDALRTAVRALDPSLPLSDIQTMEQVAKQALSRPRFAAFLLAIFAGLALMLATIGTYATISLLVAERSHEIGVRMALGAERLGIVMTVLREALLVAGGGVLFGMAGAAAVARVLESLLYGVDAMDPLTFATVPLLLTLVALAASAIPALRAASVDPVAALRR